MPAKSERYVARTAKFSGMATVGQESVSQPRTARHAAAVLGRVDQRNTGSPRQRQADVLFPSLAVQSITA